MDSTVNVTRLQKTAVQDVSKYTSIRDHFTDFSKAKICKLLKC